MRNRLIFSHKPPVVEGLILPDISLAYVSIPKVACTSIKYTFYNILMGADYTHDKKIDPEKDIHWYFNGKSQEVGEFKDRVLVIRDPIDRFLSAYSNRVTHHWELSRGFLSQRYPRKMYKDIIFNPGLGQFIEFFDSYNKFSSIEWHTRPISKFVNNDISLFNHIFSISSLSDFENLLSIRIGRPVSFSRHQSGGKKFSVKDLDSDQLDNLLHRYRDDYELLADFYSPDKVYNAWKKSV